MAGGRAGLPRDEPPLLLPRPLPPPRRLAEPGVVGGLGASRIGMVSGWGDSWACETPCHRGEDRPKGRCFALLKATGGGRECAAPWLHWPELGPGRGP